MRGMRSALRSWGLRQRPARALRQAVQRQHHAGADGQRRRPEGDPRLSGFGRFPRTVIPVDGGYTAK